MRIALVSSTIPFAQGGGRFIVDWLHEALTSRGHQVETVWLPYVDYPFETLNQMLAFRMIKINDADRIITFRPPAHLIEHPRKVVWFIHHFRQFYDLWDTPYRPYPDLAPYRALRDQVRSVDTRALSTAYKFYTNSKAVADRVVRFNGLNPEILYPPLRNPERFAAKEYGDEIVCVCRIEHHKRQHVLIEAMRHVRTPVRLRLCGRSSSPTYVAQLHESASKLEAGRVVIEERWISEEEKADWLSTALASTYVPFDEDSYGYPTLEAAHAQRCTVTLSDAGGVPEFVIDGETGLVARPEAKALAACFDRLYLDREFASRMGRAAEQRVATLGIGWEATLERLLA
jgi:glycosyltransferase involved in cell wall biosynthesis